MLSMNNILQSILYFFLIFSCGLISSISKIKYLSLKFRDKYYSISKLAYIFCFFILFVFAGFRGSSIGNDTIAYIDLFRDVLNYSLINERFEIGYLALNKLVAYFSSNVQSIIIVTSAISIYGYYRFIKKHSLSIFLSVFLFFSLRYFDASMNIIRQVIAMILLFESYNCLIQKKNIKFFVFVIFAMTFHKTAIVFSIICLLTRFKLSLKNILLFVLVGIGLSIGFSSVFNYVINLFPTYAYYVDGEYFGETRTASIMILLINVVVLLMSYFILKGKREIDKSYVLQFYIVLTGTMITLVSLNFNLFDRIAVYFNSFIILLLPNVISLIRRKKLRIIIYLIVILFGISYYYIIITYRPDWNHVYPYKFYWND